MIPEEFIEELKDRNPIADVISSYLPLRKRGRTSVGLCPFHSEKSPSFTVYEDNASFYCFGCGAGGDVVTFVRQIENLSYPEAIRFLAQRAGMTVPEDTVDDRAQREKVAILEVNRQAARFFYERLIAPEGRQALLYLKNRGLAAKTVKQFGLGFAPDSWNSLRDHLRSKGYSHDLLVGASLASRGKNDSVYDKFRSRVMFPIFDLRGAIIGFGGRALGSDGAKYLNSGDTPVFKKSRNLFALNLAKNAGGKRLILCEGYMDVISLHQAGFANAVATLGTALTPEQARLIAQYAQEVVVAYDADEAGQKAAKRASELFSQVDVKVRVLHLEGAKDPDEFIKRYGPIRFQQFLDGAQNAVEYELSRLRARCDLETADGRVAMIKDAVRVLAGIPSRVEQEIYASQLAEELSVSRDAILLNVQEQMKREQRAKKRREKKDLSLAGFEARDPVNPERTRNIRATRAEEGILAVLLQNPDFLAAAEQKLLPEDFATAFHKKIYLLIRDRLQLGLHADITYLSSQLSVEEIGRVQAILVSFKQVHMGRQQLEDYIKALKEEHGRKEEKELAEMDETQIKQWFDTLSKKKSGN